MGEGMFSISVSALKNQQFSNFSGSEKSSPKNLTIQKNNLFTLQISKTLRPQVGRSLTSLKTLKTDPL